MIATPATGSKAERRKTSESTFAPDLDIAKEYLSWLDPDADKFDFRLIWPYERAPARPARNLRGSLDDEQFAEDLVDANREGYGVFVSVNETDGKGVKADNIKRVRAVYADWDNGRPDDLPLEPSFVVRTSRGKYQGYWLVDDDMTREQFDGVMGRIVTDHGGDRAAKDIARILRVPGFDHTKAEPFRCKLVGSGADDDLRVYKTKTLVKAFPPIVAAKLKSGSARVKTALKQLDASEFDPELTRSILAALPGHFGANYNSEEEGWRNVMFAVHHASDGSEEGWDVLDEWSRRFDGYDEKRNREMWDAARQDHERPITLGSLVPHAKKNGWIRPTKPVEKSAETPTGKVEFSFPVANSHKKPADHVRNIEHFLERMGIKPWFNEFDSGYYLEGYQRGDRLDDAALRDLRMQLHELDCRVSVELMESAVKWIADKDTRHPLREYLDRCEREWDGTPRVGRWLAEHLGARDTNFARAVGQAFLIGAVRRARQPGCLARAMLVLEGPQNVGKSTVFKVLAGEEYFSDSLPLGADAKETIEETCGKWIIEFPELSSKTKKEVEEVKASTSRTHDTARTAYARTAQTVARQFVMCATTNNDKYLRDKTGNTRFWPIKVGEIDLDALRRDRDQLWGEAAHLERQGEPHWLSEELAEEAAHEAAKREVVNPIEEKIASLLRNAPAGFVPSEQLWKALGLEETARRSQYHLDSMGDAARKVGWMWKRKRDDGGQVSGYLAPDLRLIDADWLQFFGGKLVVETAAARKSTRGR